MATSDEAVQNVEKLKQMELLKKLSRRSHLNKKFKSGDCSQ